MNTQPLRHISYIWSYNLDEESFCAILQGKRTIGRLNQDWAALRLLEYAPYEEIVRLLGFERLVHFWSRWRPKIQSESRRRGLDFLVDWLPHQHPELFEAPTHE